MEWPDLARGTAVLVMFVACAAPVAPVRQWAASLATALFVLLFLICSGLSFEQRSVGAGRWYAGQVARGLALVVLGAALQAVPGQVPVALPAFGALAILGAALVPLVTRLPVAAVTLAVTVSGAASLVGAVLTGPPEPPATSGLAALVGTALSAVIVLGAGMREWDTGRGRARRLLAPVEALGRMALTAYALLFVVLAVIGDVVLGGDRRDGWWVLGVLVVAVGGGCWLWDRHGYQGPLELVVRLPQWVVEGRAYPLRRSAASADPPESGQGTTGGGG